MRLNPDQKIGILKQRARVLARPAHKIEAEGHLQVVVFMLAHEKHALELSHIREVHPLKDLTPLPGLPDFVLGITNVRGRILSIVDIGVFFELPRKGLTNQNQVIILESETMEFGILADEILGTRSIPESAMQPSLPTLTGIRAAYLRGITGDRVVVLDGKKLLSDDKMVVQ